MKTALEKNIILADSQVAQKIRRMAFEIYENNADERDLILAGVNRQGYLLAQFIGRELAAIAPIAIDWARITVIPAASGSETVTLDCEEEKLNQKCIVVVDDVLNTGRTLMLAIRPLLFIPVKKIEIAALINRSHPLFPIQPTYTGLALSTTLNETVEVRLDKKPTVYLY